MIYPLLKLFCQNNVLIFSEMLLVELCQKGASLTLLSPGKGERVIFSHGSEHF